MNWTKLEQTWRGTPSAAGPITWDVAEFSARERKLARALARRDWIELSAGLFVATAFAAFLLAFRMADWRGWAAVAIILGVTTFFLQERRRARRMRVGPESPLRVRLEAEIAELRHQRGLLRSVLLWYVGPTTAAALLFFWAIARLIEERTGHFDGLIFGKFAALMLAVDVAVWWLNRHAVRTSIDPQLRECEELRASLADGVTESDRGC